MARLRSSAVVACALLLACPAAAVSAPDVDNGRIVFASHDAQAGTYGDLFTMAADGSDLARVTDDGRNNDQPEYSPDGQRIVFASGRDAYYNIYTMRPDGGDVRRLTETPWIDGGDLQPTWAPDSMSIVFTSTRDNGTAEPGGFELYRMQADGTDQVRLTTTASDVDDQQPAVSPDGSRIAFVSDRPEPDHDFTDLFVMDVDGTDVTRLTFDATPDPDRFGHYVNSPTWSPDGTRLLFDSDRSGNREIWVVGADGTGLTNLTDHPDTDLDPAWSPDGETITWTSTRSGEDDVWSMPAPAATEPAARRGAARTVPTNLTPGAGVGGEDVDWQARPRCTITGTARADTLVGTPRPDVICGLGGADLVRGRRGADVILGGAGADTLVAGAGRDRVFGRAGRDTIVLADRVAGNDLAEAGAGEDTCERDEEDLGFSCLG